MRIRSIFGSSGRIRTSKIKRFGRYNGRRSRNHAFIGRRKKWIVGL